MTNVQKQAKIVLQSMHESVKAELDKKKRLGQYAVIWKDGKVDYLFKNDDNKKDTAK